MVVLIFRALESIEVDLPGNFAHTFIDCTKSILPNGPYVIQISTGYIFAVSKLFEDYCHAFVGKALGFNLASTAFGWLDIEVIYSRECSIRSEIFTFEKGPNCCAIENVL